MHWNKLAAQSILPHTLGMSHDTQHRKPGAPLSPMVVRTLREKAGLTQERLAERMGLSGKAVISGWETGRSSCDGPHAELLLSLLGGRDVSELSAELDNLTESTWRRAGRWGDTWRQVSAVPELAVDIDRDSFVALFPDAALPPEQHVNGFPFVSYGLPTNVFGLGNTGWVGVIPAERDRMAHHIWHFTRNASFAYREVPWEITSNSIVAGGHTHIGALLQMVGSTTSFLQRLAPKAKLDPSLSYTLSLDLEGMQGRGIVGSVARFDGGVDNPTRTSPDMHVQVSITRPLQDITADPLAVALSLVGEAALLLRPDLASTASLMGQLRARVLWDQKNKGMRFLGFADSFIKG
jgi:transcriptional regulator with XRE-family HTH domain